MSVSISKHYTYFFAKCFFCACAVRIFRANHRIIINNRVMHETNKFCTPGKIICAEKLVFKLYLMKFKHVIFYQIFR